MAAAQQIEQVISDRSPGQTQRRPHTASGRTVALKLGAKSGSGEILLFTDADIEMEKNTISRAVAAMEGQRLDHLSLIFQTVGGNWLLNGMVLDAAIGLLALFRPWKAQDGKSSHFMGVGAFNMVRTSAYRAVGGHDGIRMHPIDDIMLGKIIKEQGFRQMCLLGQPLVRVCWYGFGVGNGGGTHEECLRAFPLPGLAGAAVDGRHNHTDHPAGLRHVVGHGRNPPAFCGRRPPAAGSLRRGGSGQWHAPHRRGWQPALSFHEHHHRRSCHLPDLETKGHHLAGQLLSARRASQKQTAALLEPV
jgi:hypothetical protein